MRTLRITISALCFCIAFAIQAQEVNWNNISNNSNHIIALCSGIDYSSYYGLSYGYHLNNNVLPVILGAEVNIPFGKIVLDDWILRTGIQTKIFSSRNWNGALKTNFINRHYNSDIAKIYNIGADFEVTLGYYKKIWGLAILTNYDRSIASKIQHKELRDFYPDIKDGWYNSGSGNFKFALRVNYEIRKTDVFLTIGKIYGQNFTDNPTLPFFGKFTIQKSF